MPSDEKPPAAEPQTRATLCPGHGLIDCPNCATAAAKREATAQAKDRALGDEFWRAAFLAYASGTSTGSVNWCADFADLAVGAAKRLGRLA